MKRKLNVTQVNHANSGVSQRFLCTVEEGGYTASNEFYEDLGKSANDPDIIEKLELYFSHLEKIVRGILGLNLVRELRIIPYRAPNYLEYPDGKKHEGDLYITEVRSKDGRCYASTSTLMLMTELEDKEGVSGLTEEMYKHLEYTIYRHPERFCQCKNKVTEEADMESVKDISNEFRSQNIV